MSEYSDEAYLDLVEEYKQQEFVGVLEQPTAVVEAKNASCGDRVTVAAKSDSTHLECKWTGQGCIISQVAMSRALRHVQSTAELKQVSALADHEYLELIQFSDLTLQRQRCALVSKQALERLQDRLSDSQNL
jgi:NifU-like protein involved in Fe-S cluster formation